MFSNIGLINIQIKINQKVIKSYTWPNFGLNSKIFKNETTIKNGTIIQKLAL